jgi:CO dehydrogenase nickel-insertion accessory protein CooC1
MIKLLALFESEIEGKVGRFMLDHDTPIAAAKEMGLAYLKYLGQVEDAAKAQAEAAKAQEESKEPEQVQEIPQEAANVE